MRKIFLIITFALCFSLSARAKVLNLKEFELDNGLRVVVVSNHKAPVGLVKLYYKVGSFNDPIFKGGIAHLLEHMMFRGTKKVGDEEFNLITEENGADNNAYTTFLHTGYYEFSDISKLELMLYLEADRMENLEIDEDKFVKERDIVLEERMQPFETNPATKFYEQLNKVFWQKHPYSRPVSGEIEEIKSLSLEDTIEFYERYYRPDNAILVLSGDIDFEQAKGGVKKYVGDIKNKKVKNEDMKIAKLSNDESDLVMKVDGGNQSRFIGYWHLKENEFSKKEILALSYFCEYLSKDDTAYLYDKLVYRDKKFLSVGVDVDYREDVGGKVAFYVVPKDENMKIDEIKEIIFEAIKEGFEKVSDEKLEEIKNETLSNVAYMLENPQNTAGYVGGMLLDGYGLDEIMNYDDMLKSVDVLDVKNAWNKVLSEDRRKVYGYLMAK